MVVLPSGLKTPKNLTVEPMATTINQRFKSGETCGETGSYDFDGYVDGASNPLPSADDMKIIRMNGNKFPSIGNPERACFWILSEDTRDDDPPGSNTAGFRN